MTKLQTRTAEEQALKWENAFEEAAEGKDCYGYNLRAYTKGEKLSVDECKEVCFKNPECTGFSYLTSPRFKGYKWCITKKDTQDCKPVYTDGRHWTYYGKK